MRAVAGLTLLAALVLPAGARADSKLSVRGDVFYFINEDAGIANRLTVDSDRGRLHLADVADPYGMNFPAPLCSPGQVNGAGNPVEVFCTRDATYHGVTVQSGPGEDEIAYRLDDLPASIAGEDGADRLSAAGAADSLNGGQGADTLDAGAGDDKLLGDVGDDTLAGGDGNDTLNGGEGADALDGGQGDDTLQTSDGYADTVDCGGGEDTAVADQLDTLTNCEHATVQQVTPVPGQTGPKDTTAPALQIGGPSRQRARRSLTVLASVSESAKVDASGFLAAGGINSRLGPGSVSVTVGGGGATVRVRLTKHTLKLVRRDLRRHRHPKARITVSAVDAAGNTSPPQRLTITLRR